MKNILKLSFGLLFFYSSIILTYGSGQAPGIVGGGLPGLPNDEGEKVSVATDFEGGAIGKASIDLISTFIKYIAVIAVVSLMLGGIMYILSGGEDDKIKKAKSWIIWSLVGVFVSVSAWGIIRFITQLSINN